MGLRILCSTLLTPLVFISCFLLETITLKIVKHSFLSWRSPLTSSIDHKQIIWASNKHNVHSQPNTHLKKSEAGTVVPHGNPQYKCVDLRPKPCTQPPFTAFSTTDQSGQRGSFLSNGFPYDFVLHMAYCFWLRSA